MKHILEKHGTVREYEESDTRLFFIIDNVSHSGVATMKLFKDISDYCKWNIKKHTFGNNCFVMELVK